MLRMRMLLMTMKKEGILKRQLMLLELVHLLGTYVVSGKLIRSSYYTNPCGQSSPQVVDPYQVVAGRSKVVCVMKCSMDPYCLQVEYREPGLCLFGNSSETSCTANVLPPGSSFYVADRAGCQEEGLVTNTNCQSEQSPTSTSAPTTESPTVSSESPTTESPTTESPTSEPPTTEETAMLTTPGSASCLSGWLPFKSSCYFIDNTTYLDVNAATGYCDILLSGAHLMSLNDDEELSFLQDTIEPYPPAFGPEQKYWTSGVKDLANPAPPPYNWLWNDGSGETMTLTSPWIFNQPDNGSGQDDAGIEYYVTMIMKFGFWGLDDSAGYHMCHFVCEYEL